MRLFLPLFLLLMVIPATASAASVQEVVALSNSGVSDEVILALIERDNSIFTIDPEQLVALQRQGLSQAIILAMLRSGRSPSGGSRPPDAAATPLVATVPSMPDTVIVGHGPDRPNTSHQVDGFLAPPVLPYLVYVPFSQSICPLAAPPRAHRLVETSRAGRFLNDPTRRFIADPTQRFINNGFVAAGPETAADSVVSDCAQPPNGPAGAGHYARQR